MLISDFKFVVGYLKVNGFTGHVKFGIEKSSFVSMTKEACLKGEQKGISDISYEEIEKLVNGISYGRVDMDFVGGRLYDIKATESYQSDDLNKWVETKKCRNVKVVVKR